MLKLGASIYTFQDDFRRYETTLEEVLAFLSKQGVYGVEIVPEQTLTDVQYETIDENFVSWWKDMMDKYKLVPTNCNLYDDADALPGRMLTEDERYYMFKHAVQLAAAMNFKTVRASVTMSDALMERCIRTAADYGIIISMEVHAPLSLKSRFMQSWFDTIDRLNTSYAGIHPDAQIFSRGPNATDARKAIAKGANPEIVAFIQEKQTELKARRAAQREMLPYQGFYDFPGYGVDELKEGILRMGGGELELQLAGRYSCDDPAWLAEYAKYIKHFHGKCYDIELDENGHYCDPSIDYQGVVKALTDMDYNGFISIEYEGQRHYLDLDDPESPSGYEIVRNFQKMIRHYESEL